MLILHPFLLTAVQRGVDEDDVVAMQLGATDKKGLTEKQQFYLDKIKTKLAKVDHILRDLQQRRPKQARTQQLFVLEAVVEDLYL